MPVIAYLPTTTTQLRHFESGGQFCNHSHHKFCAGASCFDEDCIIDFDTGPYMLNKSELIGNPNIVIKGKLATGELQLIYARMLRSMGYSRRIMSDIYQSFNNAGITQLKRP